MTLPLNTNALSSLPDGVPGPSYDRSALTPGIIHIGCGNFHRAHQSWYLGQLFEQGLCMDWAIIGAGVRPADTAMRQKLEKQDWLTTLIELGPNEKRAEVIGSMIDFVPVATDNRPLIDAMADPRIRIVALTVTEGGYYIDPATNGFDVNHPDIRHDAANPDTPRTAFGAMIAALRRRRDAGVGPFSGQSCDNLQGNGNVLKSTVISLARLSDPDLADWIEAECTFPNSMVDCIVPATGPKEIALARAFGIDDAAPVTHEPFRQWVIEDKFCAGRPDWDKAGATFADQVNDFESMKIRILNGGHQVLCLVGELVGIEFMSDTMADPLIHRFFRKVAEEEIVPHVKSVPGFTPPDYLELIDSRFSNPAIVDTTRRVAFDGSSRQPGFILPSVRDGLASGAPVEGLALVSAAWCRYCLGTREDGSVIEPNDPIWDALQERAKEAVSNPMSWLGMGHIYGDLAQAPRFADAFMRAYSMIQNDGVRATLTDFATG
ncbi:MAG: mannitol dehydrogenase family protein [Alphaproteobacteria bacterium]|nr:mannitol dehydrogenase family protein [Alphaproteobacteria bacterium]